MKAGLIIIVFLSTILSNFKTIAQIREVKNLALSNQSNRISGYIKNSFSDYGRDCDTGVEFIGDIFFVFEWTGQQQRSVLERRYDEPWLLSLEMWLAGGYFTQYNNLILNPSARLHWGLFSTDLRWFRMQDLTGYYETLDWQIIQLNLLHKAPIRIYGGTGFSYEYFTETFFPEFSAGMDLHFIDRKINPLLMYRISKDFQTGAIPREEISGEILYRILRISKAELLLDLGIIYQKYYSEPEFYFVKTGVVVRTHQ